MESQSLLRLVALLLSEKLIVDCFTTGHNMHSITGYGDHLWLVRTPRYQSQKDAAVVDLLIKAGMIIIAKTNLTVSC